MKDNRVKNISKFLSLILRHKPETIQLRLDEQGWADVDQLLEKLELKGKGISFEELEWVVDNNNKKRFAFSEDKTKIRASQGHSINIDLGYTPVEPPEYLFHGTATRFLESIQKTGLEKRNRHHLHLSKDLETASSVGKRHGKLVIIEVKSKEMYEAGFEFFVSKNGVWLTDRVPIDFINFPKP